MQPRVHASADAYDPFEDTRGPVGHAQHFEVERIPGSGPGEPARFRKTIKPGVSADLLPMIHRENMLLMDMASRGLRHVAQSLAFTRDTSDTPFVVTTLDAGPSLNLWARHDFTPPGQPQAAAQSFMTPATFLRLMRHALIALREFHQAGFIHCDIHAGNICLPFERPSQPGRAVRPLFERLRLIDFGHTLSARLRFDEPLQLDPDAPESLRRVSPAFRAALRRDAARGQAHEVLRLDWRLDLYALGALASQFLASVDWDGEPRAVALHPGMAGLVDALLAQDCEGPLPQADLHTGLLRQVDALLTELAPPPAQWLAPRRRAVATAVEAARETPLVVVAAAPHPRADMLNDPWVVPPYPGRAPAPLQPEAASPPVSSANGAGASMRPAAPRRRALPLLALVGAGVIGFALYERFADEPAPAPPPPSSRSTPPRASSGPRPSTTPTAPAAVDPSEPPQRAAANRALDDDLNKMIEAAAGGSWRQVESAARSVASRAQARPPASPSALLVAGESAVERGDYADAAASLRRATQQTPDDWAAWSAYGYALLRLNDISGARLALARSLRLRPQDASAWAHLAEVLALQDRGDAAAAALKLSVFFSRQRPRTLAHLRATGGLIAPELRAIVSDLGSELDRVPERGS